MNKTELANKALRVLGVWERGQPTRGEYIEAVTDEYDELYAELTSINRQFWDVEDIPAQAARHVAVLLADRLAMDFSKNAEFQAAIAYKADGPNNHASAMSKLKEIVEKQDDPRNSHEPVDY